MRLPKPITRVFPVAVLVAAALAGGVATEATAAPPCQVTYTIVNQWSTGFQAAVNVTNNAAPVTSWTLAFQFPNTQQVTNGWNAVWSQSGPQVTAGNAAWKSKSWSSCSRWTFMARPFPAAARSSGRISRR